MLTHTPRRQPRTLEIPRASKNECVFCHSPGAMKGLICQSCGVALPSPKSFQQPRKGPIFKKPVPDDHTDDQDHTDDHDDCLLPTSEELDE